MLMIATPVDLALGVEAEQQAGRIAAREITASLGRALERLVIYRALLHDFGADRRRPVKVASCFIWRRQLPSGLLINVTWWQSSCSHSPVENLLLHRK
jgi:hypothetical protein